jgi:exopolysaccharide production protein ExoQ
LFLRIFERLFVLSLLLYSMNVAMALLFPYLSERNSPVSPDLHPSLVAIQAALYACAGLLILMRWRRVLGAARAVWPILFLVALTPISVFWSVLPMITLRRSLEFVGWTLIAIYLGERYTVEKFARLLAQTICLMIVASIAIYPIAPQYVLDTTHAGAWRGLVLHKNFFGEYMALLVALLLLVRFRQFPWLRFVFLGLACVLLFLSRSATSIVVCALVVATGPLWRLARMNGKQRFPAYIVAGLTLFLTGYFVTGNTDLLLKLLGRDSTLTGRTQLWGLVLDAVAKRPIVGYGFDAFFTGLRGESLNVLIRAGWLVPAAHNGFLELLLGLGIIGLAVFLLVFVQTFNRALTYVRLEQNSMGFWPVTYLCFFAMHNMTESDLLTRSGFSFLIFTVVCTSLALRVRTAESSATAARRHAPAPGFGLRAPRPSYGWHSSSAEPRQVGWSSGRA